MTLTKSLTLKKDSYEEFILVASSNEEIKEIELLCLNKETSEKYPFIANIFLCGHYSEFTEIDFKHIIPIFRNWNKTKETNGFKKIEIIKEYQCYANSNRNIYDFKNNVILHEDRLSSLLCALQTLRSEYFYILRICNEIKTINEFNENGELTNNNNNSEICTSSESIGETES